MIRILGRLAAGLLLLAALGGCGDDGGSVFDAGGTTTTAGVTTTVASATTTTAATTTTGSATTTTGGGSHALGGGIADALAHGLGSDAPAGTGEEEECVSQGLAGALSPERFAELDALASAGDMSAVFSAMSEDEVDTLIGVLDDCVDLQALFTQEMQGQGLSPEAVSCFAGAFSQEDTLHSLIGAAMLGDDPETNPEFMALMVEVMTGQCAEPMEAMLVDELVASGISQDGAACVADRFVNGGVFDAVVESMMTGAELGSDPDLMNQMMTVFTECLTPDEMGGLGG